MKNDFTFIIPDFPGHGNSKGSIPHSSVGFLDDYASCLDTLAKNICPNPYKLIGYSLGAYTAFHYLSKSDAYLPSQYLHIDHTPFPKSDVGWQGSMNTKIMDQFRETHNLVLAGDHSIPYLNLDQLPHSIQQSYYRALALMNKESISNPLLKQFSSILPRIPVLGKKLEKRVEWPWAYAIIKAYHSGTFDLRNISYKINVPTLLLCGQNNTVFPPASMEHILSQMPNARMISFENSNHDLPFNEPLRFTQILKDFVNNEGVQ
jgi:pimeloyl-ACP methyl ester carboxylesterase